MSAAPRIRRPLGRPARRRRRAGGRGRPKVPRGPERRYERELVKLSRRLSDTVNRTIQPHLERARRIEEDQREDAEIDTSLFGIDFGNLRILIGRLVREARVSPIVDRWGRDIVTWNDREMRRLLPIDIREESPEVQEWLREARRENVGLIQSIAERLLDDVFRTVTTAAIEGRRVETTAKLIRERYRVSDSRARLIARDQTLKANSNLTQVRHREADVRQYVWSSSRDSRVRDFHRELDGHVFDWNDPPITSYRGDRNHPGEDYQCRCVAIPVLD